MTVKQFLSQHVVLKRRASLQLEGPAGTKIRVMHGEVWITRHHDTKDYLLGAGEVLDHAGKGKTLITATRDAGVHITRPAEPIAVRGALRRLFYSALAG